MLFNISLYPSRSAEDRGPGLEGLALGLGPCSAAPQTGRGLPGEWRHSDDETDEFTLAE
jgi:hypothetical protein